MSITLLKNMKYSGLVAVKVEQQELAENFRMIHRQFQQEKLQRQLLRCEIARICSILRLQKIDSDPQCNIVKQIRITSERLNSKLKKSQDQAKKMTIKLEAINSKSKEEKPPREQKQKVVADPQIQRRTGQLQTELQKLEEAHNNLFIRVNQLQDRQNSHKSNLQSKTIKFKKQIFDEVWYQLSENFKEIKDLFYKSKQIKEIEDRLVHMNSIMDAGLLSQVVEVRSQVQDHKIQIQNNKLKLEDISYQMSRKQQLKPTVMAQKSISAQMELSEELLAKINSIPSIQNAVQALQSKIQFQQRIRQQPQQPQLPSLRIQTITQMSGSSDIIVGYINSVKQRTFQKLKGIQRAVNLLVSQNEFNNQKQFLRDRIRGLQKLIKKETVQRQLNTKSLEQTIKIKTQNKNDLQQSINDLKANFDPKFSLFTRKIQQINIKCDSLKHQLFLLKQDGVSDFKSVVTAQLSQIQKLSSQRSQQLKKYEMKKHHFEKLFEQNRKILDYKLMDFRSQVLSILKDQEAKSSGKIQKQVQYNSLSHQIQELKSQTPKKTQLLDIKKHCQFIQSKLKALFLHMLNEQETAGSFVKRTACLCCNKSISSQMNSCEHLGGERSSLESKRRGKMSRQKRSQRSRVEQWQSPRNQSSQMSQQFK